MPVYKWADLGTKEMLTRNRHNLNAQFIIAGHAHPRPLAWAHELPTDGASGNNYVRVHLPFDMVCVMATAGGENGPAVGGTSTTRWEIADPLSTIQSCTLSGIGVRHVVNNFSRTFIDKGAIVQLDLPNFSADGLRISSTLWYFQRVLARFEAGMKMKIIGLQISGQPRADDAGVGQTTVKLYKKPAGGAKTEIASLTVVGTANTDFQSTSDSLGSGGELDATDEITVELERGSLGLKYLSWRLICRPSFADSGANAYTLGSTPSVTVEKLNNSKRRVIIGSAVASCYSGSVPIISQSNFHINYLFHRRTMLVDFQAAFDNGGTVVGNQIYARRENTDLVEVNPPFTSPSFARAARADKFDLTERYNLRTNGVGNGAARFSVTGWFLPYDEVWRWQPGFSCRIIGIEVMGYTVDSAPSGTLDATLRKDVATTPADIKRLNTATASDGSFEERDDAITGAAAELSSTDEVVLRVDDVPRGTVLLYWRILYEPAVED